jgi:hypothetical protein
MRRSTTLRALRIAACSSVLAGVVASASALGACSSSGAATDAPAVESDASNVIVPHDASSTSEDADADAALAPDGDAGPRICSDDGFCHSALPKGQNLRGVWGDGLGIVWAVTLEGNILRWDGASWTIHVHATKTESGLFSIFGTGPTDIWVPSDLGLLHGTGTSSATLTFAPVALPGDPSVLVKSVWGTGPGDLWAVAGTQSFDAPPFAVGRVLHYTGAADGGGAWTVDASLSSQPVVYDAVWGSAGSGPWLYGQKANSFGEFSAVLMRRVPGDAAWKVVDLPPDPANPFHPAPRYLVGATLSSDTSVWLAGFNGNFTPSYWHGSKVADGGTGFDFTYTERLFWERPILALWGTAPNDTWAVGQDGLVTHWNGASWKPAAIRVTTLPVAKTFWGIWGNSAGDFWIVGDEIALHKTTAGKP